MIYKENSEIEEKDARELLITAGKLSNQKPYLLFSDVRKFIVTTPEAKKISVDKNESKLFIAHAVLINSLPMRLVGNFFITFYKPHYPVKLFVDEKKAHDWLKKFKSLSTLM